MLNLHQLISEPFVQNLSDVYDRTYGAAAPQYAGIIRWAGRFALESIANSDALYHNVEHTIMVTLAGQEILRGKHLIEGGVTPDDWLHFLIALLCHDIGYVKGICRNDGDGRYASGIDDRLVEIGPDSTCASLAPYHVDRSKRFVAERFGENMLLEAMDAERLISYIEMTRFPIPKEEGYEDTRDYPGLLRAADLIGQFGDPGYLRKIPALYYEFEENGGNRAAGYAGPGDMRKRYAAFYWEVVSPYIQDALGYLRVTREGKEWIANLNAHIFTVEHEQETTEDDNGSSERIEEDAMEFEAVTVETEGFIGWITLNRPNQYNTFSTRLAKELNEALVQLEADDAIRVVVVKGAGKVFSTGIDLTEYPDKKPEEFKPWINLMDRMHRTIADMGKPVVAMAHRYAVANGAGLLFAADFAVVSEETQIGTTAINLGLLCTGPIIPVSYALGKKKTLEMLLAGDMIDAREAERLGLINKVVPAESLEAETRAFAEKLAQKSPVAMALGKRYYYRMIDMDFDRRLEHGGEVFSELCDTEDAREGVSAFFEKRKPSWKGK